MSPSAYSCSFFLNVFHSLYTFERKKKMFTATSRISSPTETKLTIKPPNRHQKTPRTTTTAPNSEKAADVLSEFCARFLKLLNRADSRRCYRRRRIATCYCVRCLEDLDLKSRCGGNLGILLYQGLITCACWLLDDRGRVRGYEIWSTSLEKFDIS